MPPGFEYPDTHPAKRIGNEKRKIFLIKILSTINLLFLKLFLRIVQLKTLSNVCVGRSSTILSIGNNP